MAAGAVGAAKRRYRARTGQRTVPVNSMRTELDLGQFDSILSTQICSNYSRLDGPCATATTAEGSALAAAAACAGCADGGHLATQTAETMAERAPGSLPSSEA